MKEFMLLFRMDVAAAAARSNAQPSAEEIQAMMKPWQDWLGGVAAQNKLVAAGNRLESDGKIIKPGSLVTDGPYVEMKEAIGGYSIVKADSLEEATEIGKGCPILFAGGSVEVREIIGM